MPVIAHADLRDAVEHYELLVQALERYRGSLAERMERYRREGRDPATYERNVRGKIRRVEELLALLEGQTYDTLCWVVDGVATLEAADEGSWV